jgi:hypothetical protein
MPRYIDADALDTRPRGNNSQRTMWREIKWIVDNAPTADVAPKSEVAREIIQEVADFLWQGESERLNIAFGDHYYGKQEFIAELKKKYIGEQK